MAAESLLAILIFWLYLNDSALLMRSNHAVMEQGLFGGWGARLPTRRFTLLGKHVFMGGLLPPNSLLFKLAWNMDADAPPAPGWEAYGSLLRPFQWVAGMLFLVVMVLLPLALIGRAGDAAVVILLAFIYCAIASVWIALWFARQRLGISSRYCLKLGAEMLLCPPVAANLPRRISLQRQVDEDFLSACKRLLPGRDWSELAEKIATRIDDELELEDAGSDRHFRLGQRKESLK